MNLDITVVSQKLIDNLSKELGKMQDVIKGVVLLHDFLAQHIEDQKSSRSKTEEIKQATESSENA